MNERQALDVLAELAPSYDVHGVQLRAARTQVDAAIAAETTAPTRRPRQRPRWVVAAVVAGGLAVAGVLWPSGTTGAYATWVPQPTRAGADQVRAARAECDQVTARALVNMSAGPAAGAGPVPDVPTSIQDLADQQVKVGEQRGDFTLVVTANATWLQACLAALPVSDLLTETAMVDLRRYTATVPVASVDVLSAQSEGTDKVSAAVVVGRAGPDVSGVQLTTGDGRTVQGQLSGGYWSAWWPADPGRLVAQTRVTVLRADGSSRDAGSISELQIVDGVDS